MMPDQPSWVEATVSLNLSREHRRLLVSLPELEEAGRALLAEFSPDEPIELTLGELIDLEAFLSQLAEHAADPQQEQQLDLLLAKVVRAKCAHMMKLSEEFTDEEGDLDGDPFAALAQMLFAEEPEEEPKRKKPAARRSAKGSQKAKSRGKRTSPEEDA